MRRTLIAPLMLFSLAAYCSVQAQSDLQHIHKLLTDQVDAWNHGDIEGYMRGYWNSDSTEFVSGGEVVRGYREVLARYHRSYSTREKMGRLEFEELVIREISSAAAIATGIWRLHRATDQPWGRFTLVIEKKPEGWRITHDHTSSAGK
jgi:beta-aspartyl-peptidase (threonine type)